MRVVLPLAVIGLLAACEGVVDKVKDNETAQLVGLVLDQPCVLTRREGRRLTGAYLRQPEGALGFDPVLIDGRLNRKGVQKNIQFDDTALRRLRPAEDDGFRGSRRSVAQKRAGFRSEPNLPGVYDLGYRTKKVNYRGPLVAGPSPTAQEIPTSGKAVFEGPVQLGLYQFAEDGAVTETTAQGRFRFEAGYGSKRGTLTVSGFSGDLGFDTLTWTRLYLCGARFVSSGQGQVRVSSDGKARYPFQTGREPIPLRSAFEAAQFASVTRPGPPAWLGGVFVIESDQGTISAVFLSDDPPASGG